MVRPQMFFRICQSALIQLASLGEASGILEQHAEIVEDVRYDLMLRPERLFSYLKRPPVHLLRSLKVSLMASDAGNSANAANTQGRDLGVATLCLKKLLAFLVEARCGL